MLLKNCVYFIIIGISLLSIPLLIYSIKSKNKNNCQNVKIISIFYIVYLIISIIFIPHVLSLDIGFEMILLAFIVFIAIIFDIISIIICSIKVRKYKEEFSSSKKAGVCLLLFIVLPILIFFSSLLREWYLITNSDLILVYHSSGNGGLGDSNVFAYAINENYCKEISMGIAIGDYSLAAYLPKNVEKIDNVENIRNYDVYLDSQNNYITVYKNNELIHKKRFNSYYANIDFDGGFYMNNN